MKDKKLIYLAEWLALAGMLITTIVFLIFKYGYGYGRIELNLKEVQIIIPYFKTFAYFVIFYLFTLTVYFILRKILKKPVPHVLAMIHILMALICGFIFFAYNPEIVGQAMNIFYENQGPEIPELFRNSLDVYWKSPNQLGKIAIVSGALAIIFLPINIIVALAKRR